MSDKPALDTRPAVILDPAQNGGDPALYHSRVKVDVVLQLLDAGENWEAVAEDHGLTRADLLVACWFDARCGTGPHPRDQWLDWLEDWEPSLWQAKTPEDYEAIPFPPFRTTLKEDR